MEEGDVALHAKEYWDKNKDGRWNGRQIRNACHTALALAEFEAQGGSHKTVHNPNAEVHLQDKHFRTVSGAYLDFIKYLKEIYGTSAEEKAQEQGIRARESDVRSIAKDHAKFASGQLPAAGGSAGSHSYCIDNPVPYRHSRRLQVQDSLTSICPSRISSASIGAFPLEWLVSTIRRCQMPQTGNACFSSSLVRLARRRQYPAWIKREYSKKQ